MITRKLVGPETFPEFAIDWAFTNENIKHFKKNIPSITYLRSQAATKKNQTKNLQIL